VLKSASGNNGRQAREGVEKRKWDGKQSMNSRERIVGRQMDVRTISGIVRPFLVMIHNS
jgi:hypothetical protein